MNKDGTLFRTFNKVDDAHDIQVKLADGVSKEDVENALYEEYKDDFEKVQFWLSMASGGKYCLMRNCTHSRITMQEAIEYLEFMKERELISDGKLITNKYNMKELHSPYKKGTYDVSNLLWR